VTDKIEELARIIAFAVTGENPDAKYALGEPYKFGTVNGYAAPPAEFVRPLWTAFYYAAQSAIEAGFDRPEPVPPPAPESYVQTSLFDQPDAAPPAQDDDWRGRMGLT
jgi:hypothetical protein